MASADASARAGFKRDEDGTAPTFDRANSEETWLRVRNIAANIAALKVGDQRAANPQRFNQLVKPDGDTGCYVPGSLHGHVDFQLVVWRPWAVGAKIMRYAGGARRQACCVEIPGKLLGQDSGLAETILDTRMIVVDV